MTYIFFELQCQKQVETNAKHYCDWLQMDILIVHVSIAPYSFIVGQTNRPARRTNRRFRKSAWNDFTLHTHEEASQLASSSPSFDSNYYAMKYHKIPEQICKFRLKNYISNYVSFFHKLTFIQQNTTQHNQHQWPKTPQIYL